MDVVFFHYSGFLEYFDTLAVIYALYRVMIMYCTHVTCVE